MTTETPKRIQPVRWRDSLVVRILALCAVLLCCLFGAVYFLTGHYYKQVVTTMQDVAERATESIRVELETRPDLDPERASDDIEVPVEVESFRIERGNLASDSGHISPEISEGGELFFRATRPIHLPGGGSYLLTLNLKKVDPQTELVRAFKNRYLLGLTGIFVMTLATLVYLIAKSLAPLREFSETCAQVSEGNLQDIYVGSAPGEIRTLGETFNRMVASLREKATVEANLRRAQRLSAIGNLAAGVAHDVRNPLNAIKLLSSQALDELKQNGHDPGPAKALQTIRSEVDRLEDIVSGFLSLAKEEALRREMNRLDPILDECLNLVRKDAESRGVRVTGELRTGDLQLSLDAKKLKRAVLNVLLNALEVCPPGGRVRLFSRVGAEGAEIEVRDDGPGMAPETIEHAFDPYFTTKPTGTGLGLSITRGIIEEHGGRIRLTSEIDQGTQVLMSLPFAPPGPAPQPEPQTPRGTVSN